MCVIALNFFRILVGQPAKSAADRPQVAVTHNRKLNSFLIKIEHPERAKAEEEIAANVIHRYFHVINDQLKKTGKLPELVVPIVIKGETYGYIVHYQPSSQPSKAKGK